MTVLILDFHKRIGHVELIVIRVGVVDAKSNRVAFVQVCKEFAVLVEKPDNSNSLAFDHARLSRFAVV